LEKQGFISGSFVQQRLIEVLALLDLALFQKAGQFLFLPQTFFVTLSLPLALSPETRPKFHHKFDEIIRDHVFCSFLSWFFVKNCSAV